MSAEIAWNFFPVLLNHAESNTRIAGIVHSIFPKHILQICPVPILHLGDVQLKWPTVAAACVGGCLFGLFSGGHMLSRCASRNGFFSWGFALLWYGLMCLGGFFYHCLVPSPLFHDIDVVATACSSISIVAGSILADDTAAPPRAALLAAYAAVVVAAARGGVLLREALYLGPALAAFPAAAWFIWRVNVAENGAKRPQATREAVRRWSAVAAAGAAAAAGGVFCDQWLCLLLGSNFSLLFWFFVGCNVSIFAFFPIVVLLQQSEAEAKHS